MAIAAIKGDKLLAELAKHFDVDANPITQWKSQLIERAGDEFGGAGEAPVAEGPNIKDLHANIGQITLENDALESALTKAGLLSVKR